MACYPREDTSKSAARCTPRCAHIVDRGRHIPFLPRLVVAFCAALRDSFIRNWQRARSKTAAITAFKRPVRPVAKGSRRAQLSGSYVYFLVLERVLVVRHHSGAGPLCHQHRRVRSARDHGAPREHAARAGRGHFGCGRAPLGEVPAFRRRPRAHDELGQRRARRHVRVCRAAIPATLTIGACARRHVRSPWGLLVNVFVFSVVVAKFQAPQSDLVWSEGCVIPRGTASRTC